MSYFRTSSDPAAPPSRDDRASRSFSTGCSPCREAAPPRAALWSAGQREARFWFRGVQAVRFRTAVTWSVQQARRSHGLNQGGHPDLHKSPPPSQRLQSSAGRGPQLCPREDSVLFSSIRVMGGSPTPPSSESRRHRETRNLSRQNQTKILD